jgi:hypothetical protein
VVWTDTRNGGPAVVGVKGNHDIYYYDLKSKQEIAITKDAAVQILPDISGRWSVWEDWRKTPGRDPKVNKSNADIYAYDLATKTE